MLATPPGEPLAVVAQSAELSIQIADTPSADSATLAIEPTVVPIGEVFRFVVGYSARIARDLRLELSSPSGSLVATKVQPVAVGSGCIDMTLSYVLASSGAYTARIYLVPTGGTSAQAIASSTVQTVQVVSAGYSQWALARWGVVLGNEPAEPQLDPDGDGATNASEYIALTDPRNPASALRTTLSRVGNELAVNWQSAAGRNYQLFSRSSLSSGSWLPVNSLQSGTGGTMGLNVNLNLAGALQFYRVQVTVP
jgi:hypothetical protein